MSKLWIPALVASVAFSTSALADWERGGHGHGKRHHHRHHYDVERVVVRPAYMPPRVVYVAPPQVVYQTAPQVIYRERHVYAEPPRYAPPGYAVQVEAAPGYGSNRAVGQVIGAVTGGVVGSQFGHGDGRIAATAVGAVIGGALGGHIAGY